MIFSLMLRIFNAILKLQSGQDAILKRLDDIEDILTPGPAVQIIFTANLEGSVQTGVTKMDIRDDQQVALTIAIVDKKGKPAQVDGIPVWASSDETVITVTPAADGMSANVIAVAPGAGRVVVTADADLGAGTTDLTGTLDFNVLAGGAVTISISAGTPTDQ